MDRELRLEPEWWADWWRRYQTAQWRRIRRLVYTLAVVAVLGALVASVTYVQADNLRDDQRATREALVAIQATQTEVKEDAAVVADYVAELRARAAAQPGGNQQVAEGLQTIQRIALWIEQMTGEPLPPPPPPPTTPTTTR